MAPKQQCVNGVCSVPDAAPAGGAGASAQGYCVKCKAQSTMKNPKESVASNGRKMMQGECAKCGTKMTKFVGGAKS